VTDISRVVLIGPDGMLGRAWVGVLERNGIDHVGVCFPEFDLSRASDIAELELDGVSHIINCAAWTDVDGAEAEEAAATAVNGDGVNRLAKRATAASVSLVHYSTDYVFSGDGSEPYPVDAPLEPVNAYGRSKAVGERAISRTGGHHLVVRTSWLYAPWGHNFVRTMARLGSERPKLRVVDDQRGRPTSCEHLAATSLELIRGGAEGTYHVTDGGECTWFQFAQRIVGTLHPNCEVEPCTSGEFPRPAARPAYSVLDLSRTEDRLGPMPSWQDNLDAVLPRLEP
jgi:dTDP-4-dehydrorhamnose reductase